MHRVIHCNQPKMLIMPTKAIEEIGNFFLRKNESKLYRSFLAAIEKPLIENVLYKTGGNQLKAAKILGINRNTLHAKIKKLNIDVRDFKGSKYL